MKISSSLPYLFVLADAAGKSGISRHDIRDRPPNMPVLVTVFVYMRTPDAGDLAMLQMLDKMC